MSNSVTHDTIRAHVKRRYGINQSDSSQVTEQLDTTLKNLGERIIPAQPYLLSVPSDVPYRHSSRFINTWYMNTPFTEEEEQLQYLTFLSYQGEEDSLLKVVGGWADEKGNLLEDDTTSTASQSGQNTPIEPLNKKKISLQDYKSRDKTRPSTPTLKAPAEELRKKVMKSEAKEHASKVEDDRRPVRSKEMTSLKVEKRDSSRNARSQVDGTSSARTAESQRADLPSPRKKRRLSSDSSRREMTPIKHARNRDGEDTKDLPLLLSPTLPARQKKAINKNLPSLLLPDLPPALEKLMSKTDGKTKTESSMGQRTEQVKSMLSKALGSTAAKRPPERSSGDLNASRIRSDSQVSTRTAEGTPKVQSPAIRPATKTLPRPATPLANGVSASPRPKQEYKVTLRYGKKNSKRVVALLRFPPRAKKPRIQVDEPVSKVPEPKTTSTKTVPGADKLERKRLAEPSPERPIKKMKQLETPEKANLVRTPLIKSPANVPAVAKLKPEVSTPKRELKPSAMKRLESQDGMEVTTPQGDRGRISTPVHAAGAAKVSPGPSSSISKEDRIGWQEMNSRCFALGRTLKHEGTSLGPSNGNERTEKDQALSVILLIEALLCFMLNHAAQSQARPSVDPGWSTIFPYHIFLFRTSRKYRHLHGLVIQLGAICRQAIHNHDIERLAREPLPFDNYDSAPTPGSDGTTRHTEDFEKIKKKYVSFRDQLVMNSRELQSAWLESSRYLSPTLIEREYPKTWARRTKDTNRRGMEKLKPNAIGKEYYLPLDISSTTFEATRFALSFLKEWAEKEKIDWKPRIEL